MAEYCTIEQVVARLTEVGAAHVADRDRSGKATPTEKTLTIGGAIINAGTKIDFALSAQIPPASARAQAAAGTCLWLVYRAIDLACYEACATGGADPPAVFATAYQDTERQLFSIRENGTVIPGLIYPRPQNGCGHVGVVVFNPS